MSQTRAFIFLISIFLSLFCFKCGGGSGNDNPNASLSSQGCANGKLDIGEACDDGNINNSDGCNAHCAWEVGEAICGNGVLENDECCDDGNDIVGDGCSNTCTSEKNNRPPSVPSLSLEPHNGATWSATRLYLSWNPSTDPDAGDTVVYDVYFGKGQYEGSNPYKKNVSDTHFIIQASTDNRAEYFPDLIHSFYLEANATYTWKVCARDRANASACSEARVFNTDDSVVGWWSFDEDLAQASVCEGENASTSLRKVCDHSGNRNHGMTQGGPFLIPPLENSEWLNGALQMDGSNDYVSIPYNAGLNPDSITVIAKIKTNGKSGEQSVVDNRGGGGSSAFIRILGSSFPLSLEWIIRGSDIPYHTLTAPRTIVDNTTYTLGSTYKSNNGNAEIYLNGALQASGNFGILDRSSSKSTSTIILGDVSVFSPPSATFSFKGVLDELIIFNRVLDSNEMNNIFQAVNNN